MIERPDFLRTGRPIAPADYWRFGRILALLGIWFQTGLLLFMAAVALQLHDSHRWPVLLMLVIAVLKNLWLFFYCRARDLVDDRVEPWLASLAADAVVFLLILPVFDRQFVRLAVIYPVFGLHYALTACLRWRSSWSYLSLVAPISFLAVAFWVGALPVMWTGSLAQFLLGVVFITAAREAFVRDTRRVEEQVRIMESQHAALVVAVAERAALLGGAIGLHRSGLSPLRRLAHRLRLAGELEAARVAEETGASLRQLLGRRVGEIGPMSLDALIGFARDELVSDGIRMETRRLRTVSGLRQDVAYEFVAFLRDVAPSSHTVEIVALILTSRGDFALEIDAAGLRSDRIDAWCASGRVEWCANPRALLFHLRGI